MNEPDYARRAAQLLAEAPVPDAPPASEAHERATIAAMEAALASARAPRSRPTLAWAALAAAVLVALGTSLVALRHFAPATTRVVATATSVGSFSAPGEAPQRLTAGVALPQSSRVTTPPGGAAALEFSSGTRVELAAGTELSLDALGERQRLHVGSGRVSAHVAHVPSGGAFTIATRDAEIEVKGTRFTVEVVPADPGCTVSAVTRVTVDEGVVLVRFDGREVTLRASERWPRECFEPAAAPVEARPGSSLAAQNDLFAQAVTLKRQGDAPGAISLFEHLMEAWPDGPLAESAEVERMKLLAAGGAPAGAEAARAYLDRYPQGFARAEASALVQKAK